jgi:hypothetical protein
VAHARQRRKSASNRVESPHARGNTSITTPHGHDVRRLPKPLRRFRVGVLFRRDPGAFILKALTLTASLALLALVHALPAAAAALTWQQQDIGADDGAIDDRFGDAVAIDGDTAIIGAFDAKIGDNYYQGAAYVFTRQNGSWTQAQKLLASDGAGTANFGAAVAISGDTILVSAISANVQGHSNHGQVYVFTRTNGTWSETQRLASDDGASGDAFGNAIALQGNVALIGAQGSTVGTNTLQGKVYVFSSTGSTWSQQQMLTASDGGNNDLFGHSLALDGSTAVIGAPTFWYNFSHAGFMYVFTSSGGTWSFAQKVLPTETALGDQFGYAVGIAGDTALASSTGNQFAHGAVTVFKRDAGMFAQTQRFTPDNGAGGDEFGNQLSMSGNAAVIGAQRLVIDDHQGAAYLFAESEGTWSQQQQFTETTGTSLDFFGGAVAFDGRTILIGTPGATVDGDHFVGTASLYTNADDGVFCNGFEDGETGACGAPAR